MANAELKVRISADGRDLVSVLVDAKRQVSGFGDSLTKLEKQVQAFGGGVKKFTAGTQDFVNRIKSMPKPIGDAATAMKQLPKSSNAATLSLINLGRVAQDAPFGILGIANNINPLLESFQRLQKETGSTKTAFKSLVSGLTGAGGIGLAVSVVTSLLIVFGDKLFGAKKASEASETALRSFADALESVKDGVKDLNDELDFANQLGSINIKIGGFGELKDLQEQSVAQREFTAELEKSKSDLEKLGNEITANTELNAKDRLDAMQKYHDSIRDINKDIRESEQKQTLIYRKIALQRIEDQKKADEELLKLKDKFIDDTISRAKRLASYLQKTTIRNVVFELDPELPRSEQFDEAVKFIQRALNARNTFTLKPQVIVENPTLVRATNYFAALKKEAEKIFSDLQAEIDKLTRRNPILIRAEQVQAEQRQRGNEFFSALGIPGADENAPASLLTDTQRAAVNLASVMNQTVLPAFNGLFDAIRAGENPVKAFFQSLGQALTQLIQKLIAAVLQAALLSAITGGAASFGKSFKSLIGFRAEGGPVFSGKPYVVGEKGPELFIPQGGGRIVPNNEMNAGLRGITPAVQSIHVTGEISGRSLRLVNARQAGFENRNA